LRQILPSERADQAKLLKAEALYKQQNCAEAAPIFEELRASQLSARLRADAAYKLGLCHAQMKNTAGVIEAFTYYVQAFPDDSQAPAAWLNELWLTNRTRITPAQWRT
jgi:TolA-binding protein